LATQILAFQPIKANFVYEILRSYPKINEFWFLEPAVKAKMLTFVCQLKSAYNSFTLDIYSNISAIKAN